MIKIETKNETSKGFDIETRIEGNGLIVVQQMASILDRLYEASPDLFEKALLLSQYTKDHT
jgi:hypothetical protein